MRAVLLTVLLAASCAPEEIADTQAPIVGGTVQMEEPAVVLVKVFGGVGFCTGTLVTDRIVVTAKHCVQAPGADRPYPPSSIEVGFGWQVGSTMDVRGFGVATTPGVYTSSSTTGIGGALVGIDVGVITLREPIAGVTPIPVSREPAESYNGSVFTAVGFGQTDTGGSGTKYTTTGNITGITGGVIFTASTICQGDSGGPMIIEGASPADRRIVGVASFGEAGACPSRQDGYNRLDQFLGLIDEAIIASGGCPEPGLPEECNSIDDDCDGTIDEGCAGIGETCTADADCAFAQLPERFEPLEHPVFCGDTPAGRACTRACDAMAPRTSCGEIAHPFLSTTTALAGVYCARTEGCDGLCVAGDPGSAAHGEDCTADADCASLFCTDPGDGRRRCLTPCQGGAGLCYAGEVCAAIVGACGACVAPAIVSGARALGEPCTIGEECGSGVCLLEDAFRYCSRACAADLDCGDGFHCRDAFCARGPRSSTGERCTSGGDCIEGDSCGGEGAHRFCTHLCSTDGSCPEGFRCGDDGLCTTDLRVDGEACRSDDECLSGTCGEAGDRRRCIRSCGERTFCPSGLECRRVGTTADGICAPPFDPPGGCSATGASGEGAIPLVLLLIGALGTLRRRSFGRG